MPIPEAREASDLTVANTVNDTGAAFNKTIVDAINVSIGTKTNTATISFSGKAGADVMNHLQELRRKGYKVTQSGTNFTITW